MLVSFQIFCEVFIPSKDIEDTIAINTENVRKLSTEEIEEFLDDLYSKLKDRSEKFEMIGSGWSLVNIQYLQININDYKPLHGSRSKISFVKTPKKFLEKD